MKIKKIEKFLVPLGQTISTDNFLSFQITAVCDGGKTQCFIVCVNTA
jgi:hypothetical protein